MLEFKRNISVDEAFEELEKLDVYKSNEEIIDKESYNSICNAMLDYPEFAQLLEEFDNLVNPFMNKSIIISDVEDLSDFEISFDNEWIKIRDTKNCMQVSFKRKNNTLKYKCSYFTNDGKEQMKISHIISDSNTIVDMKVKGMGIEIKNTVFLNECYKASDDVVMNFLPYLSQTIEYLKNCFLPRIAANSENVKQLKLKNNLLD